jgi:hypothetical protein
MGILFDSVRVVASTAGKVVAKAAYEGAKIGVEVAKVTGESVVKGAAKGAAEGVKVVGKALVK